MTPTDIEARFLRLQHRLEAIEALLLRSNRQCEEDRQAITQQLQTLQERCDAHTEALDQLVFELDED